MVAIIAAQRRAYRCCRVSFIRMKSTLHTHDVEAIQGTEDEIAAVASD